MGVSLWNGKMGRGRGFAQRFWGSSGILEELARNLALFTALVF